MYHSVEVVGMLKHSVYNGGTVKLDFVTKSKLAGPKADRHKEMGSRYKVYSAPTTAYLNAG